MADTIFLYKGTDKKGKVVQGELKGASTALVKAQLLRQGVKVKSVRKKPKPLFGGGRAIKPQDIAVFTRQMATMMKAGVPLVQSFEIVADGAENPRMETLILEIKDGVASGSGFANSLRQHPKYFDDLFCSLVESGEQSGALETMLDRIATYKEKTEALKAKIKKAMTYPIAVLVVALIVTGILLVKVVPQFAETFSSFGADLPAFTLFVLGLSNTVQEVWYIILAAIIAAVWLFAQARRRSQKFSDGVDRVTLKLPIIGNIIYNSVIARFSRTLATTFAAGVPLIDALTSVSGAAGNAVYRDSILNIRDDVATGMTMYSCLRSEGIYPSMLIQMTSIGEESGSLDEMLDKVAAFYEDEVDNMVDNLTTLLEPMIMAILGVLVGGLMIAMYLPIFQLGQIV
ncbi:type II secretion system F family protein [Pseudoteredinibacter isoporae]|uniref:Type IV pilus assembly protein PilC n=1 Tax=Pseudoteredinibacter isoporae TaxID=570281 RepID=A0A7X0JUW1_9GAMM|nr:type II secretion system F family protein [Pseudoteredinibacter isoporae]MBB6522714.1 type IV pilus assembly protein PilC [Pseudoteredinibacter isoporae]NHO88244.1 type II secretion system F family protein [Pseudoteredinibacter isoporae]NIB23425.1 type II secretion system F family protein [Pseudoteredinibacter isoporae]